MLKNISERKKNESQEVISLSSIFFTVEKISMGKEKQIRQRPHHASLLAVLGRKGAITLLLHSKIDCYLLYLGSSSSKISQHSFAGIAS